MLCCIGVYFSVSNLPVLQMPLNNLWKYSWRGHVIFCCIIIFNPFFYCESFRLFPISYSSDMTNISTHKTFLSAHLIMSTGEISSSRNTDTKARNGLDNTSAATLLSRNVASFTFCPLTPTMWATPRKHFRVIILKSCQVDRRNVIWFDVFKICIFSVPSTS